MKIINEKSYAIVSTTISDINNHEMRQMYELKNRIEDVLKSHLPESKEKKYISDDDLKLMGAILSVFTKKYACTQTSAFDDELKEMEKEAKPHPLPEDADLSGGSEDE